MNDRTSWNEDRPRNEIGGRTIWIDLDNSPHVLFFRPIIRELEKRGCRVVVTARDYAQVIGLADMFRLDYTRIGRHYGGNKVLKALGLMVRSLQMIPILLKEKPDLALSHGSRSQILIARIFRLPTVMAFDYEHTRGLPFVRPTLGIVPEMVSDEAARKAAKHVARYPGIKEDVYGGDFTPDPGILGILGIDGKEILATIRPPATAAHYHTSKSDALFEEVVRHLADTEGVRMVMVPRTKDQEAAVRRKWAAHVGSGRIVMPDRVVNGLNLVWHSDMVISAGGTMIREAAALGVPAYSIFGGELGAVDRHLDETGRLVLIEDVADVRSRILIKKRRRTGGSARGGHETMQKILDAIETFAGTS
jgi:uncharacterized protein